MKEEEILIIEANEILRSLYQVITRKGEDTNWEALEQKVKDILTVQHTYINNTINNEFLSQLQDMNEKLQEFATKLDLEAKVLIKL
jgi:hypothetical protein